MPAIDRYDKTSSAKQESSYPEEADEKLNGPGGDVRAEQQGMRAESGLFKIAFGPLLVKMQAWNVGVCISYSTFDQK